MKEQTTEELKKTINDIEVRLKEYSVYVNDRLDLFEKNHLELVEALIEALKGVRLQGAQQFAFSLEKKYFPSEEVVEERETITI